MTALAAAKHGFMAFWYSHARVMNSLLPSMTLDGKRLVIFPGVYKPLENEQACAEYCREGDRVLDLGCGSGVASLFCAAKAREVVAVDISLPAVRNTQENCRLHGLNNVVVMQSDMFAHVEGKFDVIMANAPYIDAEFEAEDQQFATSRKYLAALFAQAGNYLTADGRLVLQFPSKGQPRIERLAREHGLELVSVRRLPPKTLKLSLLSILYLQVGFKSALYQLKRRMEDAAAPRPASKPRLRPAAA